jgi:hypothetical protein
MAYLDHYLEVRNERLQQGHKAKPRQIIKGARRQHVINRVMDILRDWRFSHFEHEGACYAGLRSTLCLEGHRWILADMEGYALVGEALRLMGAKRPTWLQGQPEYTARDGNCFWCNGEMPAEVTEGGRNDRFCSTICAHLFIEGRAINEERKGDVIDAAARAVINRTKRKPQTCQCCKQQYVPFGQKNDQRFCSKRCADDARRIYQKRACEACGSSFTPLSAEHRFCSRECVASIERTACCIFCKTDFMTRSPKALYCSWPCTVNARRAKEAGEKGRSFIAAGVSRMVTCDHCELPFEAKTAKPRYCGDRCKRGAERLRLKQRTTEPPANVIYLTAEIFDSWFQKAA